MVIVRDDMQVTCDGLTADYDDNRQVKLMTCQGHVYMHQEPLPPKREEREVWGETAVFDNQMNLLTVTGSPRAREGKNRMRGTKVIIGPTKTFSMSTT